MTQWTSACLGYQSGRNLKTFLIIGIDMIDLIDDGQEMCELNAALNLTNRMRFQQSGPCIRIVPGSGHLMVT